jgi:predicted transcriptional regulator YdeE
VCKAHPLFYLVRHCKQRNVGVILYIRAMDIMDMQEMKLIGLVLPHKTTNANGQSGIDCGHHWQEFEKGNYISRIPGKLDERLLAVYHDYEGDHTAPYSYFIGCVVKLDTVVPDDMDSITIPSGRFDKRSVTGIMPDCVADGWKTIWGANINRAYQADYEVYDERSKDWSNATVDIYLSVKGAS